MIPFRPAAAARRAAAAPFKRSLGAVSHALLACSLLACAAPKPLSPWAASERAAALANAKCQERYGARPFAAEDFEAVMEAGRWTWGAAGERPIDGYAVEVSFEPDGRLPAVEVHRDEHLGNPEGL